MGEIPLLEPVILSVSASISARTSSKSTNFFPLQCRNSAYSAHTGIRQCTGRKGNGREREKKRKRIEENCREETKE